jgi:hypothetical protein
MQRRPTDLCWVARQKAREVKSLRLEAELGLGSSGTMYICGAGGVVNPLLPSLCSLLLLFALLPIPARTNDGLARK